MSLGQGIINTYASYVREKQDITLERPLTTSTTNEFAEVDPRRHDRHPGRRRLLRRWPRPRPSPRGAPSTSASRPCRSSFRRSRSARSSAACCSSCSSSPVSPRRWP
ncbi:MAG: hypothetical protein M0C28_14240 [Candidatus Moduliflexus flocculans]|nr:hypothetical protein [Candidatus Moduliflexus flocculans]